MMANARAQELRKILPFYPKFELQVTRIEIELLRYIEIRFAEILYDSMTELFVAKLHLCWNMLKPSKTDPDCWYSFLNLCLACGMTPKENAYPNFPCKASCRGVTAGL